MEEITWHYPDNIEEAAELVARKGLIPHGGGLGILMGGAAERVAGFVDLSRLPIRHFQRRDGQVEFGAAVCFADTVRHLRNVDPGHILVRALGGALSTPLRNRATLGGSIAQFPIWSDLVGPLLALDAQVDLVGASEGSYPVAEYVTDRDVRKGSLITAVRFADKPWKAAYRRVARTRFDYSAFNVSVLAERNGSGALADLRVVVVGCANKFHRPTDLESLLRGKVLTPALAAEAAAGLKLEFPAKKVGSPEYLKELARVELERALLDITE
ncbi:MAG: FAD binding domain-containing protein [Acidobacteria bacterium]|nr:FAD binding domain-containing protein [Acidobacteriota bacterium]